MVSLRRVRTPVTAKRFLTLSIASLVALQFVVTSGAFVRLTGSGLGCENWPRCGSAPFPTSAAGYHAFVEFGNRLIALVGIGLTLVVWLAARRVEGLDRWVRLTALAAFLGTVAQIPLGGVTVILELHPVAVMSHFLLALVVTGLAVVVALEAWSHHRGRAPSAAPRWLQFAAAIGVVACAVMVVTGAVATASGPHPGADEAVERLGLGITDTVYVHVRATAVYGIWLLLAGWQLLRLRRALPGVGASRGSCSPSCSRRCSSARSSTATRSHGVSCSCTSRSAQRSGVSRSRSRTRSSGPPCRSPPGCPS
ncbi:MAG: COX15/CtaA family protein [Gaiella sp.]